MGLILNFEYDKNKLKFTNYDNQTFEFKWHEIIKIETYKTGLITFDCINLHFYEKSGVDFIIDDETENFDDLCKDLISLFPSISNDLWQKVAHPAFQENRTILYQKS